MNEMPVYWTNTDHLKPTSVYFENSAVRVHYSSTLVVGANVFGWIRYKTTGDLSALILSHLRGDCPFGMLVDRLEEYPNELDCNPDRHRHILSWLRAHQ